MCLPVIRPAPGFSASSAKLLVLWSHSYAVAMIARRVNAQCANQAETKMIRIADREIKVASIFGGKTRRKAFYQVALLLCFAFFSHAVWGQSVELKQAQAEFDNGNYAKAIELAEAGIEKAGKIKNNLLIGEGLEISASSQISLFKYAEAENTLNAALQNLPVNESAASLQKAIIHIRFAWLRRQQRKFAEALDHSKKAVAAAPNNRRVEAEHYFNVGRILFTSGYDIPAVVWLEKAEKLLEAENNYPTKLDVYRFLSLAWSSKLNYQTAIKYAEKWVASAEKTRFRFKHRQALFELSTVLSASGQKQKAFFAMEKGLKLSVEQSNSFQACLFLTSLLTNTLLEGDATRAADYLNRLEKINADNQFDFEIKLGKAVISAFRGQTETSENLFTELGKMEKSNAFAEPYWKITVAEKSGDWEQILKQNQKLLELATKENYREDLPGIYLNFAKVFYHLGQLQKSAEFLEKSLSLIEEARKSEDINLSIGLLETYHNGYRLLAQIKSENPQESFELSDFLKARLLKERINDTAAKIITTIAPDVRQLMEELSIKFINDQSLATELEKAEKLVVKAVPALNLDKPTLTELNKITGLNDAVIISYFFTLDKKLMAFVWEKGKPLQTVYLPVAEDEVERSAKTTQQKIKNLIFFKRDGRNLYDKLLKPLNLTSKHLIIVPDKSLWKIPFQALSSDGEKYLIEEKLISYTPSVSILLEQLKSTKSNRQTLQAFANSSFENKRLEYVNAEASTVAEIYNSKPVINATVNDFTQLSEKADILHFSMHAEVENEQPLDSFLGFRKLGKDDGRLTVEELLNIKLKKGSLMFLASCDTNNVLNGEGLVSLAWGMMGSGATTIISAQWEANDKSTAIFTNSFYKNYKQGNSAAEAMQKAALELIKDKSNNMHEPYYWADFTLNGDYR
jgi:CHAT domain-containing protein